MKRTEGDGPNPSGMCICGCGGTTAVSTSSAARHGYVKGTHQRYIRGHHRYLSFGEYLEQDCGYETPCWVWQRSKDKDGYGKVWSEPGSTTLAHRRNYERENGPVPADLTLDHLCRNRACVNPSHLEPVTHAENCRRGASAILTMEQAGDIRSRLADSTVKQVALMFGVAETTIRDVAARRLWTDTKEVRP